MTTTRDVRKPMPRTKAAAVTAVRNHLAGLGFGEGHGGFTVAAHGDTVRVAILHRQFADPNWDGDLDGLTAALENLTTTRMVDLHVHRGHMFLTYTYTRVSPDGADKETT